MGSYPPTGTCGTSKSPSGWPRETSKPDRSSTANANRSRPTLTIVFAALAVARHLQDQTGVSIKRLMQTLRPLQSVTITIAGQPIQAQPRLTAEAEAILAKIPRRAGH